MKRTITKVYSELPFAHRQHNHEGHCHLIHGHSWTFEFTFAALILDENQFVIDFGKMKWLKSWLEDRFDHTLVLNQDDPCLAELRERLGTLFAKIVVVPNCGAEGLAAYLLATINWMMIDDKQCPFAKDYLKRSVRLQKVVVREDSKNSAEVELT